MALHNRYPSADENDEVEIFTQRSPLGTRVYPAYSCRNQGYDMIFFAQGDEGEVLELGLVCSIHEYRPPL